MPSPARREAPATRRRPFAVALISWLLVAGIVGCSPTPSGSPSASVPEASQAAIASLGPLLTLSPPPIDLSGVPAKVHVDATQATATWIGPAGGKLSATAADGTAYELDIPGNAVPGPTPITMTPITSVDSLGLSGGVAGAVFLQPAGLALAVAATLHITSARTAPSGTRLVGFDVADDGATTDLIPASGSGSDVSVLVLHFSAPGAAYGTSEDLAKLLPPSSPDMAVQLGQLLAIELPWDDPASAQATEIIKRTWFTIINPELRSSTTDAALRKTIEDWVAFVWMLNLHAHVGDFWSPSINAVRYTGSKSLFVTFFGVGQGILGDQISDALDGNMTLCKQSHDLKALANIMFWAGLGLLYDPTSRNWNAATGGCATIVVATFNPATNLKAGGADSLQLVFKLEFSDGTRVSGDFEVALDGSGFTFASSGSEHLTVGSPAGTPLTVGTVAEQGPPYGLTASACWFLDGLARNLCSAPFSLPFGAQAATPPPTAPAPSQSTLGPLIQVENGTNAPVVGICQSWPVWFGVGHGGRNVSLATSASFAITGDGSLDPGTPADSPQRKFRAGSAAGSATITASGYVIVPQDTIHATLTITIDPLAGVYRDPSTKMQLVVESGLGHSLPAGTYWLLVSGFAAPLGVVPSGSAFNDSSSGHALDINIGEGSATGTIDGQSVVLPRVCGS